MSGVNPRTSTEGSEGGRAAPSGGRPDPTTTAFKCGAAVRNPGHTSRKNHASPSTFGP